MERKRRGINLTKKKRKASFHMRYEAETVTSTTLIICLINYLLPNGVCVGVVPSVTIILNIVDQTLVINISILHSL